MFRFRLVFVIVMTFAFAVAGMPTAAQDEGEGPARVGLRPDAPTYAMHGPYWVGAQEFVIDLGAERPLPGTLWYPALNSQGVSEAITYVINPLGLPVVGNAIDGASVDMSSAPYPLVIFSHGNWGTHLSSSYLAEHLASYGFVVMAIDHTGNTVANAGESQHRHNVWRPQDIIRAIHYAEALAETDDTLKGVIDTENVAVSGHSLGAYTAMAAAGAQMNISAYKTFCTEQPDYDPQELGLCASFTDHADELAQLAGLPSTPNGLWPVIADPRVDAAVLFAPGTMMAFGEGGLKAVTMPVLIFAGSGDTVVPPTYDAYPGYGYVSSPQKALVTLAEADHYAYVNDCDAYPWAINAGLFAACSDPVWDMDRAHDLINHFTTAFLLDVLKGDPEAHAALLPDAVSFPGITYETTMQ